ncbi:hypothetical protein Q8A73_017931 [Channa argus]|nr:hypothetical protein Q8A73_017931 [Channa argus]
MVQTPGGVRGSFSAGGSVYRFSPPHCTRTCRQHASVRGCVCSTTESEKRKITKTLGLTSRNTLKSLQLEIHTKQGGLEHSDTSVSPTQRTGRVNRANTDQTELTPNLNLSLRRRNGAQAVTREKSNTNVTREEQTAAAPNKDTETRSPEAAQRLKNGREPDRISKSARVGGRSLQRSDFPAQKQKCFNLKHNKPLTVGQASAASTRPLVASFDTVFPARRA